MKLNSNKAIEILDECKGIASNDYWIVYSKKVGNTAGILAK